MNPSEKPSKEATSETRGTSESTPDAAAIQKLQKQLEQMEASSRHLEARLEATRAEIARAKEQLRGMTEGKGKADAGEAKAATRKAAPRRPRDERKPERLLCPLRLPNVLPLDDYAAHAESWDALVEAIRDDLEARDVAYRCATYSTSSLGSIFSPERVAWTYLLIRGLPAPAFVDERRAAQLEALLAVDREACTFDGGFFSYDWQKARDAARCPNELAHVLTALWENERFFTDRQHTRYDFDYALSKVQGAEELVELYVLHMGCSKEQAAAAVRSYTDGRVNPKLLKRYPGWDFGGVDDHGAYLSRRLQKGDVAADVWAQMYHPFFSAHVRAGHAPATAAKAAYEFFKAAVFHFPFYLIKAYEGCVTYQAGEARGEETADQLLFTYLEHYSQHDGGGGFRDTTRFWYEPDVKPPAHLRHTAEKGLRLPPCKAWWQTDGKLHLLEPFGLKGTFFLEQRSYSWD